VSREIQSPEIESLRRSSTRDGGPSATRREDLERWIQSRRAGAERERQERVGLGAQESMRGALSLIRLAGELHGWPMPEDAVSRREDEAVYRAWARLRAGVLGR
jgi:hypothetical protein